MPNIRLPKPEVEAEFEVDSVLLVDSQKIKLTLRPILGEVALKRILVMKKLFPKLTDKNIEKGVPPDNFLDRLPDAFKSNIPVVLDHVVGWDLLMNDKPIPCTKENKKIYLLPLLWFAAKGKKKGLLVNEIIRFISDLGNFTKN